MMTSYMAAFNCPSRLVLFLACRKALLPHSEAIKRKLRMKSEDSVGKFRRTFTMSYSVKKRRLLNKTYESDVTETVVGLDDDYPAEAGPDADSAQEVSDAHEAAGHVEIHTS